jgi:hypothetical protein
MVKYEAVMINPPSEPPPILILAEDQHCASSFRLKSRFLTGTESLASIILSWRESIIEQHFGDFDRSLALIHNG